MTEIPTRQLAVFSAVCHLEKSLRLHVIKRAESCGTLGLVEEETKKFPKRHAPSKRRLVYTSRHSVTLQKTCIIIKTPVRN
jgi:hypothetical protein